MIKQDEIICIVEQILDCVDRINFGSTVRIAVILKQLGYEFIDSRVYTDIEQLICKMSLPRGYVLEKIKSSESERIYSDLWLCKKELDNNW